MKLTIEQVDNGYVLKSKNGTAVYKINEKNEWNKDHLLDIFSFLIDYFEEFDSDYDKVRLLIGYKFGENTNPTEIEKKELKESTEWTIYKNEEEQ